MQPKSLAGTSICRSRFTRGADSCVLTILSRAPASRETVSFLHVDLGDDGAVLGKPTPRPSPRDQIEIELTNGRTLRIDIGVDADVLRRLIRVVEEA